MLALRSVSIQLRKGLYVWCGLLFLSSSFAMKTDEIDFSIRAWRIQLYAKPRHDITSLKEIYDELNELSKQHPDLTQYPAVIIEEGTWVRIQLGSFPSAQEAIKQATLWKDKFPGLLPCIAPPYGDYLSKIKATVTPHTWE